MDNITIQRRKFFGEPQITMATVRGENSVVITDAKNSKLVKLSINILQNAVDEDRKIVFRGKNLFNPTREFQNTETYLGSIDNLKAGIESGQMLFYGVTCAASVGETFLCSVSNQYWIICPVINGLSYAAEYCKSNIILLDENLVVVKTGTIKTILNDVNAKYLAYYCYNRAQSIDVQKWTLNDVITKGQIEIGTVQTDYVPYVEPQEVIVPKYVNYDNTGVSLPLKKGEGIEVDYQSGIVRYNGNLLPTQADFCQSILGLSCPSRITYVETVGIYSMLTAVYYC